MPSTNRDLSLTESCPISLVQGGFIQVSFWPVATTTALFKAADSDGNFYYVQELSDFEESIALGAIHSEWTPGSKSYCLRTGEELIATGPEEYTVIETGQILKRLK